MRTVQFLAAASFVALAASACTVSDIEIDMSPGAAAPSGPSAELETFDLAAVAFDEQAQFWESEFPDVFGRDFDPVDTFEAYDSLSEPLSCGSDRLDYAKIEANAFYCPADDYVAWDIQGLIEPLRTEFGDLTIGIVISHEFAHAVQVRGDLGGPSIVIELQADCLAGAWASSTSTGASAFHLDDATLDETIEGLLQLRDGIGTSARNRQAHGSGLDRISAFLDGLEYGVQECLTYQDDPPAVVAIPFSTVGDFDRGGNLPIDRLVEPLLHDVNAFYDAVVGQIDRTVVWPTFDLAVADGPYRCNGETIESPAQSCEAERSLVLGIDMLRDLEEIGDFAVGGAVARIGAEAALELLGIDDRGGLTADCLTGAFSRAAFDETIRDRALVLSPGDLDEIILTYLAARDGRAFERVQSFRSGFFSGLGGCIG